VAAWIGREFGGGWIHVYVWLNPFTVHLNIMPLLIGYTPIQNEKVFLKLLLVLDPILSPF